MASAGSPQLPCLLEHAMPEARPEDAARKILAPALCGSSPQRRWYSVLAELQTAAEPSTSTDDSVELVARYLSEALQCVQGDEQWNCSGIAQMLQRALEMSERGCVESARKAAVGLLDFHKMVEKYRQVVASQTKSSSSGHSTGSAGKRQGSDEMESDFSEDACGPLKRQRTGSSEETSAADDMAGDQRPSEFAVPHLPAKKSPNAATHSPVASTSGAPAAPASVVWSGSIWQNGPNSRDLVYCKISVPLPEECAKELADADLEIAQLAPRRGVKLGRHRVCKCTFVEASTAQLSKLKSMAQNELVALAPLEKHGLIFVPYLDNAGGVRLVCFCLAL